MERELLLLGLLREHGMHGYQLHEFIGRYLGSCTDLKKPTAYFLLDKMTQAGWVIFEKARAGKRPVRRIYRLTNKGEKEFRRLLRENLARHTSARFGGDIGLAFMNNLKPDEVRELLLQRRGGLAAQLLEARNAPEHPGNLQLVVEHQRRHLATELDWLDEVLARLDKNSN